MKFIVLICFSFYASYCFAQNSRKDSIPILFSIEKDTIEIKGKFIFSDASITDTLYGYIRVGIVFDQNINDTIKKLSATNIKINYFELKSKKGKESLINYSLYSKFKIDKRYKALFEK